MSPDIKYVELSLRVKLDAADAKTMASCEVMWYWLAKARTCSMHSKKMVMRRAVTAVARLWRIRAWCWSSCLLVMIMFLSIDGECGLVVFLLSVLSQSNFYATVW